MATKTQLAWAAGLFDGEGCVHLLKSGKGVQLSLGMTDRATVERFAVVIGLPHHINVMPHSKRNPNWNDAHYWRLHKKQDVLKALALLLPYLVAKTNDALSAREYLSTIDE